MNGLEQLFAPNDEDPVTFQYILLHTGAKNRVGVAVAQGVHAGNECLMTTPGGLHNGPVNVVSTKNRVYILEAPDSQTLMELSTKLREADFQHCIVVEPDEPWNGAATALGTSPLPIEEKDKLKPFFAQFKPLKDPKKSCPNCTCPNCKEKK